MIDSLNFAAARQDYLWFLAFWAWTLALMAWRRWGGRSHETWVPWSAAAAMATCGTEMAMSVYSKAAASPFNPPQLWGDLLLGLWAWLAVAGWGHELCRSRGWRSRVWMWVLPAATVAGARWTWPEYLNIALLLVAAAVVAGWLLHAARAPLVSRFAITAAGATSLFSSHGSVADLLNQPRRWMELSHAGVFAALWLALSAGVVLWSLWDEFVGAESKAGGNKASIADAKRVLRGACLWLVVGYFLSGLSGWRARRGFEDAQVSRVEAVAAALDVDRFEDVLAQDLSIDSRFERAQPSGMITTYGRSYRLNGERAAPLHRYFDRLRSGVMADVGLGVSTFCSGQSVLCFTTAQIFAFLNIEHPVGTDDLADWEARKADFRPMLLISSGETARARAPIISSSDEMLGWVISDQGVARWVAVQAQARLQMFLVVALGFVLMGAWYSHREREREKDVQVRAAALAREGDRLKGAFLAKVSHELRTPLQGILGYAELGERARGEKERSEHLASIASLGKLLSRLVNDLIDLSAIESGVMRLTPQQITLPGVLVDAAEALRGRAVERNLQLVVTTGGDHAEVDVMADPERLRQIVFNLVGNALKFTSVGEVRVAVELEAVRDNYVVVQLSVTDTGPGIPAADQEKLFRPFSRLSTEVHVEGLGLGLAIVQGLCRQMNGRVTVVSDGQSGATFTVRAKLPCVTGLEAPLGVAKQGSLLGHRLLVAEDHDMVRRLFVMHLESQGVECAMAVDGEAAWKLIQSRPFDTAIVDISMPGLNGVELARRVRAEPEFSALRLIAVSAHARPEDRADAIAAGFDEFLIKPVELSRLTEVIGGADDAGSGVAGLRRKLRSEFCGEAAQLRDEIVSAWQREAWPRMRERVHYLRNSAFAIDDPALLRAVGDLEVAIENRQYRRLEEFWQFVRNALAPWLQEVPPENGRFDGQTSEVTTHDV